MRLNAMYFEQGSLDDLDDSIVFPYGHDGIVCTDVL